MIKTRIITDGRQYTEYLYHLVKNGAPSVFDSETIGLKYRAPIIGFAHWDFKGTPVFAATDNLFKEGIPLDEFLQITRRFIPRLTVVGHNLKYDLCVCKGHGIADPTVFADTSLMIHVYDPTLLKKLETRVHQDLGVDKPTYEQIIGKKWEKVDWDADVKSGLITLKNMGEYACEDVYYTGKLYHYYNARMDDKMQEILTTMEYPMIFTLRDAFARGVSIDVPFLQRIDKDLKKGLAEIQQEIYKEAGSVFNIRSRQQLGKVLYDDLGIKCIKATKKGARATGSDVMEVYAMQGHRIAELLLKHSQMDTLQTRYSSAIPLLVDEDGKLRCSLTSEGTATGRFSSSNPNLQNQPNDPDYPIRKAFVASPGCKLLVADLSQIEPRIMAHVSQDPRMLQIYRNDGDIYIGIAKDLGIDRPAAKIVQLAISYGLGPDKLSFNLKISKREAEKIIHGYYSIYKVFKRWKDATEAYATKNGCIYTLFGRRRLLPGAKNPELRSLFFRALRQAVNTVMQGSAADMIKLIMNKVDRDYQKRRMRTGLLLSVHDELLADSPYNEVEEGYDILINGMEKTVKLSVPIVAEGKVCDNWHQMKDKSFQSLLPEFKNRFPIQSAFLC